MSEFFEMIGLLTVVCAGCLCFSYLFANRRKIRPTLPAIPEGTSIRLVGPSGAYRSTLVMVDHNGIVLTSPMHRNSHVPLRVGDSLMVQVPLASGVLTFRSTVTERDAKTHQFTLETPVASKLIERRTEGRDKRFEGTGVVVNGVSATLVDLSAGGAKLVTSEFVKAGEVVRVQLPSGMGVVMGWALESTATAQGHLAARELRVRFETPLAGLGAARGNHLFVSR